MTDDQLQTVLHMLGEALTRFQNTEDPLNLVDRALQHASVYNPETMPVYDAWREGAYAMGDVYQLLSTAYVSLEADAVQRGLKGLVH